MFKFNLLLLAGFTFGLSLNAMENNKDNSPLKDGRNIFNHKMKNEWRKQANSVGRIAAKIANDENLSAIEKANFVHGLEQDMKSKIVKVEYFQAAFNARREFGPKRD